MNQSPSFCFVLWFCLCLSLHHVYQKHLLLIRVLTFPLCMHQNGLRCWISRGNKHIPIATHMTGQSIETSCWAWNSDFIQSQQTAKMVDWCPKESFTLVRIQSLILKGAQGWRVVVAGFYKPLDAGILCSCSCPCNQVTMQCFISQSCWLSVAPRTVAHQAPRHMEFSRQEYWSGLPFPPPFQPGIEPVSPAPPASPALAGRFFTISVTTREARSGHDVL